MGPSKIPILGRHLLGARHLRAGVVYPHRKVFFLGHFPP